MQTYDIKDLQKEYTLQYPEVLTQMFKPEGAGLVVSAGNLPWVPVFFAKEGRI